MGALAPESMPECNCMRTRSLPLPDNRTLRPCLSTVYSAEATTIAKGFSFCQMQDSLISTVVEHQLGSAPFELQALDPVCLTFCSDWTKGATHSTAAAVGGICATKASSKD